MAEQSNRFCPNCGTLVPSGQRFCSNCGATVEVSADKPTELTPSAEAEASSLPTMASQSAPSATPPPPPTYPQGATHPSSPYQQTVPPPPPSPSYAPVVPPPPPSASQSYPYQGSTSSPYGPLQQSGQNYQAPTQPTFASDTTQVTPDYAKPQPTTPGGPRRKGLGGGAILVIVVLLVALLGGGGFVIFKLLPGNTGKTGNTGTATTVANGNTPAATPTATDTPTPTDTATATNTTPTTTNSTPTSGSAKTIPFNASQSFVYSGVKFTIVDVKQADTFSDDQAGTSPGIVRLDIREESQSSSTAFVFYTDSMRLVLPDGTSVSPKNVKTDDSVASGVKRDNWIDFSVPTSQDATKTTLRVGKADEAQMDIPLTGNADLSKYQPRVVTPNTKVTHDGLNWTLTQADTQLSYGGQQANKDQIYVQVTFTVDNPTTTDAYPSPDQYMRLTSGSTTSAPEGLCDAPFSIKAGQTNAKVTCAFKMPQGSTDFTLKLAADTYVDGSKDDTIQFQIK